MFKGSRKINPSRTFPHRAVLFLFAIWLLTISSGQCQPRMLLPVPTQAQSSQVPASETPSSQKIAAGDLIDVEVFDTPELSGKRRVSFDGYVDIPVAGKVRVSGLSPIDAASQIAEVLKAKAIMLNPQVTALVVEYSSEGVSVLGEVGKPGNYVLLGQHSLYDALAQAGGFTHLEGSSIIVTHREDPGNPVRIPVVSPNYSRVIALTVLQPGDVVVVSRADSIFVVGDVQHSGEYPIVAGTPLNALQALALASGPNRTAKVEKASIIRESDGVVRTIPIDLKKISQNRQPDVMLQSRDILVVPRSGFRTFLDYALPNATGAVAGAVAAALVYR